MCPAAGWVLTCSRMSAQVSSGKSNATLQAVVSNAYNGQIQSTLCTLQWCLDMLEAWNRDLDFSMAAQKPSVKWMSFFDRTAGSALLFD